MGSWGWSDMGMTRKALLAGASIQVLIVATTVQATAQEVTLSAGQTHTVSSGVNTKGVDIVGPLGTDGLSVQGNVYRDAGAVGSAGSAGSYSWNGTSWVVNSSSTKGGAGAAGDTSVQTSGTGTGPISIVGGTVTGGAGGQGGAGNSNQGGAGGQGGVAIDLNGADGATITVGGNGLVAGGQGGAGGNAARASGVNGDGGAIHNPGVVTSQQANPQGGAGGAGGVAITVDSAGSTIDVTGGRVVGGKGGLGGTSQGTDDGVAGANAAAITIGDVGGTTINLSRGTIERGGAGADAVTFGNTGAGNFTTFNISSDSLDTTRVIGDIRLSNGLVQGGDIVNLDGGRIEGSIYTQSTVASQGGTINVVGQNNTDIYGNIGAAGNELSAINFTSGGSLTFKADHSNTPDLDYKGNINIFAPILAQGAGSAGRGTITLDPHLGPTAFNFFHTIGDAGGSLATLDVADADATAVLGQDAFIATTDFGADGTVILQNGVDLTGNVVNSSGVHAGLLRVRGGTVNGDVGAADTGRIRRIDLGELSNSRITGTTHGETINIAGANLVTFGEDVHTGRQADGTGLIFQADGTVGIDNGKRLDGDVSTTVNNQGNLAFLGDFETEGLIGQVGGLRLNTVDFRAGKISIGHDIAAATTTFQSGTEVTYTDSKTVDGDLDVYGTLHLGHHTLSSAGAGTVTLHGDEVVLTSNVNGQGGTTVDDAGIGFGHFDGLGTGTFDLNLTEPVTVRLRSLDWIIRNGATYTLARDFAGGVPTEAELEDGIDFDETALVKWQTGATADDAVVLATVYNGTQTPGVDTPNAGPIDALMAYTNPEDTDIGLIRLGAAVQNLMTVEEVNRTGAQLRTENSGASIRAATTNAEQAFGAVGYRVVELREAARSPVTAEDVSRGLGVWAQATGMDGTQERRSAAEGFDISSYGFSLGADTQVTDNIRIGVAYSYGTADVEFRDLTQGNQLDVDSHTGILYGTYSGSPWYVDGLLSYSRHNYDSTRIVDILGTRPEGDFSGSQITARLEGGYPVAVGSNVTVTPFVRTTYTNLDIDSYTEAGGGAADLRVESQNYNIFQVGVGGMVQASFSLGEDTVLQPQATAFYGYDVIGDHVSTREAFAAGGSSWTVEGPDAPRSTVNLGLGLSLLTGDNLTISASYDAKLADGYRAHMGRISGRIGF